MSEMKMKSQCRRYEKTIQRDIATDFQRKLRTAYVTAAVDIKKKYALNHPRLKFFCALDPDNHL